MAEAKKAATEKEVAAEAAAEPAADAAETAAAPAADQKTAEVADSQANFEADEQKANQKDALTREEKLLGALSYVSFFCILALCLKKKSAFCQHHGKQGLVLTGVFLCFGWLGVLGAIFALLLMLLHLIPALLGIVKAAQGEMWKMPFICKIADKIDLSDE